MDSPAIKRLVEDIYSLAEQLSRLIHTNKDGNLEEISIDLAILRSEIATDIVYETGLIETAANYAKELEPNLFESYDFDGEEIIFHFEVS